MRYKVGDLVKFKGEPVLFKGIFIVLDVSFNCFTLKDLMTGAIFQADSCMWEKIT